MLTLADDQRALRVELAWATEAQIRSWSGGEVRTPESLNYRTLRPERHGLYAEETFGALTTKPEHDDRRERFGHIELAVPVPHPWAHHATGAVPELVVLPVLPPAFRPMLELGEREYQAHELSDHYRAIVNYNQRLSRLGELGAPANVIDDYREHLMLAVRRLFDNGRAGTPLTYPSGRILLSLADVLADQTSVDDWKIVLRATGIVAKEGP